jgi:methionyl-tRNA formyltransferase
VINGDAESGVTLMQMNAGLDTGDILFQEKVAIGPQETGESLYEKLAELGGQMIVRYLPAIESGDINPVPQDDERSSYAPMLRKEMGEIDWTMPAAQIERRLRGMLPWPGAYTKLDGHVLKVWKAEVAEPEQDAGPVLPGTVLYTDKSRICVRTGDGVLALLEVQAEGKKRMGTDAFLRGTKIPAGTLLGA